MRRLVGAVCAGGVALAGLTACGSDAGVTTTSSSSADTGPGRQLTQEEALLMMPLASEVGGVDLDESEAPPGAKASKPAVCQDLRFAGPAITGIKDATVAQARIAFSGVQGGESTVMLRSYSVEVPDAAFDDAGAAIGQCADFALVDPDDTETRYTSSGLGVEQIGSRTFAGRFTQSGGKYAGTTVDYLAVKDGHNLITVVYAVETTSTRQEGLPVKLARLVHDKLAEEPSS